MAVDVSQRVLFTASADQTIKVGRGDRVEQTERSQCLGYQGRRQGRCWCRHRRIGACVLVGAVQRFHQKFEGGHDHMVSCLKWLDGCVITGSSDANICVFDPRVVHSKATLSSHKVPFGFF